MYMNLNLVSLLCDDHIAIEVYRFERVLTGYLVKLNRVELVQYLHGRPSGKVKVAAGRGVTLYQ